ncbi:MAG: TPM domain-containing protein [Planctomycetes bacterium]|nr:TPM domain-containing protein [Planctomycetota bacterium]
MKIPGRAAALLAAFALAGSLGAEELPIPALGWVVDQAELLTPEEEKALEGRLREIENSDGTQIAIFTLKSLEGKETIEGYANRVFNTWGLGSAKNNNGVLVLLAVEDRAARIEVGRGLEGRLTDILSMRILEEAKPSFREGKWHAGLDLVSEKVVLAVRGEYKAEPAEFPAFPGPDPWFDRIAGAACLIVTLLILGFIFAAMTSEMLVPGLIVSGLVYPWALGGAINAMFGTHLVAPWGAVTVLLTLVLFGGLGFILRKRKRGWKTWWFGEKGRSGGRRSSGWSWGSSSSSRSSSWSSGSSSWSSGSSSRSGGGGRSSGGGASSRW